MKKQKDSAGFSRFSLLVAILSVAFVGLSVFGIAQDASAKKLFTAPLKVSSSASSSNASKSSVNADDQVLASTNVQSIDFDLESYFTALDYYPGSIQPNEFLALQNSSAYSGSSPVTAVQQASSKPKGVTYTYTATPAGCTTAAKNCQHFTLTAKDSKGNAIGQPETDENN